MIVGQVFDGVGAGVEGVEIIALWAPMETDPTERVSKTNSTELGDFALTAPHKWSGKVTITARKPNYGEQAHEIELNPDDPPPFVDFQLGGAITLKGTVRNSLDNGPLDKARIVARGLARQWTAETGPNGEFQLEELFPGPGEITVEAESFARETLRIEDYSISGPLVVMLRPEKVVRLRITDTTHRPVDRAAVETVNSSQEDYQSGLTNAEGICVFRGLSPDTRQLQIRLSHPGYVSSIGFDRVVELPTDARESEHTLVLATAGTVAGKIIDAASGAALSGARVCVGDKWSDEMPKEWTDYDGTFRVTGIGPGRAIVTVHMAGFSPEMRVIEVVSEQEVKLDIGLPVGREVSGTVLDADGRAVAGAYLTAERWREHSTLGLRAVTDKEGRFVFFDAPPDAFSVSVARQGYERIADVVVGSSPAMAQITLKPKQGVSDASGAPSSPRPGQIAPALELITLDGKPWKLSDHLGKTVLLDFWATWCGPCRTEIPHLLKLYEEFGGRGDFVMVGISLDFDSEALKRFVTDQKIGWTQVVGDPSGAQSGADAYGVKAIPALFLVGPDGKIVDTDLRGVALRERLIKQFKG